MKVNNLGSLGLFGFSLYVLVAPTGERVIVARRVLRAYVGFLWVIIRPLG